MIDKTAIRLLDTVQRLCECTKHGFLPFSEWNHSVYPAELLYDNFSENIECDGLRRTYPVVKDFLIDEGHHQILRTFGQFVDEQDCEVLFVRDFSSELVMDCYVEIRISSLDISIVIQDGNWEFA